ncbi:hypothetical protein VPH35_106492 [Triticum aestivum]
MVLGIMAAEGVDILSMEEVSSLWTCIPAIITVFTALTSSSRGHRQPPWWRDLVGKTQNSNGRRSNDASAAAVGEHDAVGRHEYEAQAETAEKRMVEPLMGEVTFFNYQVILRFQDVLYLPIVGSLCRMANKGNPGAKRKKKQEAGGQKNQEAGGEKKQGAGGKKKPTLHCLALEEERGCKKFNEYMQELANKSPGKDICVVEPSRGDTQTPGEALLIEEAQTAILRVIHLYMDEIEEGWCFSTVSESNTVVTNQDIPKILKDNRVRATAETVTKCVTGLAEMLKRVVMDSSPSYRQDPNINKELRHLLGLIRRYKFRACTFLIKYHAATVPLINRLILFIMIYDHTVEILRRTDPKAYNTVMTSLDCPANWDNLVRSNNFLLMYYDWFDLARAQYQRFPEVMVSMQTSLHSLGELQALGTQYLFPAKIKVTPKGPES